MYLVKRIDHEIEVDNTWIKTRILDKVIILAGQYLIYKLFILADILSALDGTRGYQLNRRPFQ